MISDAVTAGLAGMRDASLRVASAADAISRPPPQEARASESTRPVDDVVRSAKGSERPPDVDLARELIELRRAAVQHGASARAAEAGLEVRGSLLDIKV